MARSAYIIEMQMTSSSEKALDYNELPAKALDARHSNMAELNLSMWPGAAPSNTTFESTQLGKPRRYAPLVARASPFRPVASRSGVSLNSATLAITCQAQAFSLFLL